MDRSPFFPGSPWFTPAGNGEAEADLRTAPGAAAIEDPRPSASSGRFTQVGPNPFQGEVSIGFVLESETSVVLLIFDAAGRKVAVLAKGFLRAGEHRLSWNGRSDSGRRAASGVYWARLEAAGEAHERKIVLTE
jgi:hypothetical protein